MEIMSDFVMVYLQQLIAVSQHGLNSVAHIPPHVLLILLVISCFLVYSGLLDRVQVKTGPTPYTKLVIAYKFGFGDRQQAHQCLNQFSDFLPELPRVVLCYAPSGYAPSQRSGSSYAVGMVVSRDGQLAWLQHVETLRKFGYGFTELPGLGHAVLSGFPHRNYLSVCLAAFRVLSPLRKYVKRRHLCAHPILELQSGGRLHFVAPLACQFDYYVSEAKLHYHMLNIDEKLVLRASPDPPPSASH